MKPPLSCRPGCGACCIAPSISSPIPDLPQGKPAVAYSVLLNHCDISKARQTEEMVCRALVDMLDGKAKTGSASEEDK